MSGAPEKVFAGFSYRKLKEVLIEPDVFICITCLKKKACRVDGKEVQPCPDCDKIIQDEKYRKEIIVSRKKTSFKKLLDAKYADCEFTDLKTKNESLRKSYSRCHWWADNWRKDWMLVISGNQGTGKGMIKNCILKTLGRKGISFTNVRAWEMWQRVQDIMNNWGSVIALRDEYCSTDCLCIDEIGRTINSLALKNFLFEVTEKIYNDGKSLIIVSNLLITGKNDKEGIAAVSDFIDLERIKEKANIVPFPGESHRPRKDNAIPEN